jgi:hypothetical protein
MINPSIWSVTIGFFMKKIIAFTLFTTLLPGLVFAGDDHHDCKDALEKLKASKESDFTGNGHHEYQQAKQAQSDGDFKKCADQANKALSHQKQSQG